MVKEQTIKARIYRERVLKDEEAANNIPEDIQAFYEKIVGPEFLAEVEIAKAEKKDRVRAYNSKYLTSEEHREARKKYQKCYYNKNKKVINLKHSEYMKKHKEKYKEYYRKRYVEKYSKDPVFKAKKQEYARNYNRLKRSKK